MPEPLQTGFVTYTWLIGTAIGMIAVLIPAIYAFGKGKVNKEFCKLMHDTTDKVTALMQQSLVFQGQLLQQTHDTVVRIEAIIAKTDLNKK